ncbi:DUF2460 domain-containing protein [Aurantiacibacter flavus]|uniref:DUF2460 domain-containing protein n=1 Tax=Aurantiacibacter flavus TaxID=3145232 RepID=A0ABV0CY34_9SPHN
MAYWLARKRNGQDFDYLQRFDPRFWTVDFPRPEMASLTTIAHDGLRIDCEFHHRDALAGLIWESEDRYDHPLLAYATDRDYAHTSLRFRWRSAGVVALDQVHGPTLTIEGRDASGAARTWYVRLWNYAEGAPDDASVMLPFSELREGWLADGDAVHPSDIDRMFISLVPPGHDPADHTLLPARANGWVELTGIACEGHRAMVKLGDVVVPPHDVGMATAYDDSYNLTPARVLRNVLGLGYRGAIVHYVGMSHFYRLARQPGGELLVAQPAQLCTPCEAWHRAFFAECARLDYQPIVSLSYELFAEHCPPEWSQRAYDGSRALTGWEPPSTLLSPANDTAMAYLRTVAGAFTALVVDEGLSVHFQIGEPWWWLTFDGHICLYDDAVIAARGSAPEIPDLTAPLDAAQLDLLDWAGATLAASTAALRDHVRTAAGGTATVYLLVFTPTLLDPARPELCRASLPEGWAWPAYDRLQVEDYDWLTARAEGARRVAYDIVQARLRYPLDVQDYLAGFVLNEADAESYWQRIDRGLDEARARGVERLFVWALPQVTRDGYTRLPSSEDTSMQAFDDVLYPLAPGRDVAVSPEFSTSVALTASGFERRNSHWSDARLRYDVGPGIRSEAELGVLLEFFRARRGAARGFRLADPFDFSSNGQTGTPTASDQLLGLGDGETVRFQLAKRYGAGGDPQVRPITRPRLTTVVVSLDHVPTSAWTCEEGGWITLANAAPAGAEVRVGFLFDVPVRFAEDRLDICASNFAAGEAPSVPLIEIREAT